MTSHAAISGALALPCGARFYRAAIQVNPPHYSATYRGVDHGMSEAETLYLVRETKGTKDFLKLRTSEADKVRCGQKHFELLGVAFSVVVPADEV